ncbi:cell wall-binding repeat-containing protein [Raoultibacter phocaeensis]|uniref:cell wall-binding repeat-containing protein n=1 Tax=Raoultibacter phocaeensis TaxID=2479841 RepID=UPI0015D5C260|nr:cell wall-binding repeat-containing protein [Raoultibacter phocaeensis]
MPDIKWIGCTKYNPGRGGYRVKQIVPHIAECTTMAGVDATFAGPREASTHYCVDESSIHQYVSESDTAWAVGNWVGNRETISIEHVGTTANPPSSKTLDRSAELMADIAKRYGWSELVLGQNVGLHKWYSATSCPATLDYNYLVAKANAILRGSAGWSGPGEEIAGASRTETARAIADKKGWTGRLMRTSGDNWPDLLTGMWVAGRLDANILYGGDDFYLSDGTGGLCLGSDNRYGTNRYCLDFWEKVKGLDIGDTCFVVPGNDYPDGVACAWASYNLGIPIVLYEDHRNFRSLISRFERAVAIGNTVPKFEGETERIAGVDRGETAVAVAERFAKTWKHPVIVTGSGYADGLSASQWVGDNALLFAEGQASVHALERHRAEIETIYWIGDENAIPHGRRCELSKAAGLLR